MSRTGPAARARGGAAWPLALMTWVLVTWVLVTWDVAAFALALPAVAQSPHPSAQERGDAAFRRRAQGFRQRGEVDPGPAASAVAAYEEALGQEPGDLGLRFKLMEALYFQGTFTVADTGAKRALFQRQLELARETLELVEGCCGGSERLEELTPADRAERLQGRLWAPEAHFWAAVSWGLWGRTHGNLAAVRQGVATKVRDHAEVVRRLDESYADAGGLRLLGRLHTVAPRVPFLTGWVDRREGIARLRRACQISLDDPRNPLFLAEALLEHEPESRDEALALLREVSRRRPDPERLVEESEVLAEARRVLAEAGGGPPQAP